MKFEPRWISTLVIGTLLVFFILLGNWQLERARYKEALMDKFDRAASVTSLTSAEPLKPYTRLVLDGSLDQKRHILVDNQIFKGVPGVHVLTPFQLSEESQTILVNRGWLPLAADRQTLPTIEAIPDRIRVSGHLEPLRLPGRLLGDPLDLDPDLWPQLVTYPDMIRMEEALDITLYPQVLYLSADSEAGFEDRDWKPVSMPPKKHRAYAFQWFALALTSLVAWLAISVKRPVREQA